MEKVQNVKTVKISMKCDKCKIGYMERCDNVVSTTYPPKYQHKCNHCGHIENYTVEYPHLGIKKIEDDNFKNNFELGSNDVTRAIIRCLFKCVEDIKDLGYSYEDFNY